MMDSLDTHYVAVKYRAGTWLVVTNHTGQIVSPPLTRRQADALAADLNSEQLTLFPANHQLSLFDD